MITWRFMRFGRGWRQAVEYIECLERTSRAWMVRSLQAEEKLRNTEARLTGVVAERDALEQQVTVLRQSAAVQPVRPVLAVSFPEHEEHGHQPLIRVGTLWDLQGRRAAA